jgi:hypothetical protein
MMDYSTVDIIFKNVTVMLTVGSVYSEWHVAPCGEITIYRLWCLHLQATPLLRQELACMHTEDRILYNHSRENLTSPC